MITVDKIKNLEDYPNNMQRNICIDELNKAIKQYKEFENLMNTNFKQDRYMAIINKLLHYSNINIESVDDEYIDFVYGNEHIEGVSVFLSIGNNNGVPYLCKNFDIFVKGLDYEYNCDIDDKEIILK